MDDTIQLTLEECVLEGYREELCGKREPTTESTFRTVYSKSYYSPYLTPEWIMILSEVRNRDQRKCVVCGKNEIQLSQQLVVHHMDHNSLNNEISNLVSLCRHCHGLLHKSNSRGIELDFLCGVHLLNNMKLLINE